VTLRPESGDPEPDFQAEIAGTQVNQSWTTPKFEPLQLIRLWRYFAHMANILTLMDPW